MRNIGFSTGCLYKHLSNLKEVIGIYQDSGANALEISLATPQMLFDFNPADVGSLGNFSHLSIHAPFKEMRYGSDKLTCQVTAQLKLLYRKLPNIRSMVLHPDIIDDFEVINSSKLPFAIENMDKRKFKGTTAEEFIQYACSSSLYFVLDLQHAYEHDPSMSLAKRLIDIMGKKLTHFHVSGCTPEYNHYPGHLSDNRKELECVLLLKSDLPIIFEGHLGEDYQNVIRNEILWAKAV